VAEAEADVEVVWDEVGVVLDVGVPEVGVD
jgi:hypothetical protein